MAETTGNMLNKPEGLSGIHTGYPALDDVFDGWQETELVLVGARPSMGKTAITVNFMLKSALEGHCVTYIPAETGDESIIERAIAIYGNLPVSAMRNPVKFLAPNQLEKFKRVSEEIAELPIHVEQLRDIREIRQLIRERKNEFPDRKHLVIVDHLAHLKINGMTFPSRTIELEEYCMELKEIAKDFNVCMMLLSQLSRDVEKRPDKTPVMSDLRDSGALEQIADVVAMLYRASYYMKPEEKAKLEKDVIDFIITKNRRGALEKISFEFKPTTNRVDKI
jgi:replicative DNA helicase